MSTLPGLDERCVSVASMKCCMLKRPEEPGELGEEHRVPDVKTAFIADEDSPGNVCHLLGKLMDHKTFQEW